MKTFLSILLFVLIQSLTYLYCQNLLNGPECVVFDSLHNRYLVSNWNNGNIIAIDSAGNQSYFKQRSGHALGNCIAGNSIYVSTGNTILGLDLDDPNDTTMYITVAGTSQMDGMTVDDSNNLYVVASMVAKVYKVNLITQEYSVFVPSGISTRPQDIIYDRNYNRLIICSWYDNSPIQAVDLNDSTISNLVLTTTGNCDGLALDGNGNYYFSTWLTNAVYSYDTTFTNPPVLFSSGHNGPSNICFNKKDNIIVVPNFNSNSVNLVPVLPSPVEDGNIEPTEFNLFQNYPNPFNPNTKISYRLSVSSFVSLKVYDVLGNEIETLINEIKSAGDYQLDYFANELSSGIYFYSMIAGDFIKTMKMTLLK